MVVNTNILQTLSALAMAAAVLIILRSTVDPRLLLALCFTP